MSDDPLAGIVVVHKELGTWPIRDIIRAAADEIERLEARVTELEAFRQVAQTVHDTFKQDLNQGYRTADKTYAVEMLGAAIRKMRGPTLPTVEEGDVIIARMGDTVTVRKVTWGDLFSGEAKPEAVSPVAKAQQAYLRHCENKPSFGPDSAAWYRELQRLYNAIHEAKHGHK